MRQLTLDQIRQEHSCTAGIKWFEHFFPEGASILDIISQRHVPKDFLHWGYEHLNPTDEEKLLYWQKLNIQCDNPHTVIRSNDIIDSTHIVQGEHIKNSAYIAFSNNICNSQIISCSSHVQNSNQVVSGTNIINSNYIYKAQEVQNSQNIIFSTDVLDSQNILRSNNVIKSFYIVNTNQANNCCFINNGNNLSYCLFCNSLNDQKYQLFNQPISPDDFQQYWNELVLQVQGWQAPFVFKWNKKQMPLDIPSLNSENKYCQHLPPSLLKWVQTLPNFDSNIFYNITGILLN